MICAGIDAGSRTIEVVLVEAENRRVVGSGIDAQGVKQAELASDLFERVLLDSGFGREQVATVVATGYGRNNIPFADTTITEITCHAVGVRTLIPKVRTVLDIGGQDSKIIRLDEEGSVRDFATNDRCAAGTGRFLELVADRLDVPVDTLGRMAERADSAAIISSMCAVFAETEIIGLLAAGVNAQSIVAGVQTAIASRIASMAGCRLDPPVVFTGGVALLSGMEKAIASAVGHPVTSVTDPQFTGALGAAILGVRRLEKEREVRR